jgi:hypothetical protein
MTGNWRVTARRMQPARLNGRRRRSKPSYLGIGRRQRGGSGFFVLCPPVPPHHARSCSTRRSVAGRALRRDPGEEVSDRPVIGRPGDLVPDSGGEEFKEAPDRGVAGAGDRRRHGEATPPRACGRRCPGPRRGRARLCRSLFMRLVHAASIMNALGIAVTIRPPR